MAIEQIVFKVSKTRCRIVTVGRQYRNNIVQSKFACEALSESAVRVFRIDKHKRFRSTFSRRSRRCQVQQNFLDEVAQSAADYGVTVEQR